MKKILALLLALTMVLALAACGGNGNDTQEPAAPASSNTENTPANDAPASDTPADDAPAANAPADAPADDTSAATSDALPTVEPGKLIMSTEPSFPPYEMTDDSDNVYGIDPDIAAAIAEKLGLELVIDPMDFDTALLAAQQGKCDIVAAGVTVNDDRLAVMDFTDSYANGVQVVIVPEGSDITLDNLSDQTIGTQRGTTGNIYCTDDFGDDHVIAYDNGITAVQALLNGQVDCVVIDSGPASEFVAVNPGLTILDTAYANEDYAIGLAKNSPLTEAVNGALKELIADGTVQEILDRYIAAE